MLNHHGFIKMDRVDHSLPRKFRCGVVISIFAGILASLPVDAASAMQSPEAHANGSPEIEFVFKFNPPAGVAVKGHFKGGPQGFTVLGLCVNHWLGLADCDHNIRNLTATEEHSGKNLTIEHPEPNIWIFDNAPGEEVRIEYEILLATTPSSQAYQNQAREDSVTFFGNTSLLLPEHLISKQSCLFRYTWSGNIPPSWQPASSFAVGEASHDVSLSAIQFLSSIFSLGKYHEQELHRPPKDDIRAIWINSQPDNEEATKVLETLALVEAAVERDDTAPPPILWFFLPVNNSQISAIALNSSIAVFVPFNSGSTVSRTTRINQLQTIAHELVHHTNPGKIILSGAPKYPNLIEEGAAEFLARRALLHAGVIDRQEWLQMISAKISNYWLHREAVVNSDEFPENMGDIVLLLLDSEIRRHTQGKKNVTTLLDSIVAAAEPKQGSLILPWRRFAGLVGQLTAPGSFARLEDILLGRSLLVLPYRLYPGCASVVNVPVWSYNLGFDLAKSAADRRVAGVRPGGAAWRAGLRNGEPLVSWSVQLHRAEAPAEIWVRRSGHEVPVTYFPRGHILQQRNQQLKWSPNPQCEAFL